MARLRDGRASAAARRAVAVARAQLGSPYVWGAEGPATFDCSGLTSFASARSIPLVPGDLVSSPTTPAAPAPSTTSACTSARA
ncbi:MAG: NlpC/P60 family protein [Actinomycetes bacterium]